MKRTAWLLAVALLATSAPGRTQWGDTAMSGVGTAPCSSYLASEKFEKIADVYVTWIQGFLSGMNAMSGLGTLGSGTALTRANDNHVFVSIPDADTIKSYLSAYCSKNPQEVQVTAALRLYKQLKDKQSN